MKFYQETTVWEGNFPNHIYLLTTDKSKMYGYIKQGTEDAQVFSGARGFDPRGRTFVEVKELGEIDLKAAQSANRWEVSGSKGDKYIVEKEQNMYTCTCAGFKFRGQCRHIDSVTEKA